MKRLRALAASLALLTFGGPIDSADAGVKVRYFKGQPTYISTMPASAVEVAVPEQRKGKRVMVAVVALNFSAGPTSLGYENVDIRTARLSPRNWATSAFVPDCEHAWRSRVRLGRGFSG